MPVASAGVHLVALDPDPRADPTVDRREDVAALRSAVDRLAVADDQALGPAVAELLDVAGDAGVRTVTIAAHPAAAADDQAALAHGGHLVREMLQLRRPLPLPDALARSARPVTTRPFRPGTDDEAWLAVNNRAFAWHPEQAGWTPDHLSATTSEPWFDPDGFLVHDGPDGRLDGFCWTKVHPAVDGEPALGEIFVIGVDPDAHGRGVGRALVVAGLAHLAASGLRTAMLYVEADNVPARRLYDDLGFAVHERHRWWTVEVAPPAP